ncbi:hypothetical protein FHN55_05055 [Streptomyces sp. NP160]|uniref:hypothetical protein n=1 Tax=Streptomyces sp. NP160 TaxID=2586637 RepID=UPI00111BBB65|nr:hypothetical protein [Streptomyces sp. NP160]TNM69154.1 hypothetical protein FHN55_05055 [Streptomyces sp. NP160]
MTIVDRDRAAIRSNLDGGQHDGYSETWSFSRAVSFGERELLLAAGASEQQVRDSTTDVVFLSPSVRARRFSQVRASTLPGMPTSDPGAVS